jgi:endo-1,4-beta-mannosidase
LRFGLPWLPEAQVEWQWIEPFEPIQAGEVWRYTPNGERKHTAFCPVEPVEAVVLARDSQARPAVLLNRLGAGRVVFVAYPIEYCLASSADVHASDQTYRLYRALAQLAGLVSDVRNPHPDLEISIYQRPADAFVWVINHSWQPVQHMLELGLPFARAWDVLHERVADFDLRLKPKQVRILRLEE